MQNIGRTVAGAREMLGWDQGDLAAAVAEQGTLMSARTLGRIERGEREPRAGELAAIADVLGVPISWFYTGPEWLESANVKGGWLTAAA